ncbi:MAG: urease accessory protein [Rhodospirillaceae bacterium]|nr:urease accessory protein [Rhodospirillaceae bacterium]MBT4749804.1 urease accessory protein [Rhodospirillaceae bacterium]
MLTIVVTGILLGMRHALEADHVAAVAALATGSRGARQTLRLGLAWGAGHTLTIFAVGSVVLLLGATVPEPIAAVLETAVGVMLILLGANVLRRMIHERVHFHRHRHGAAAHFHAHSHAGEGQHDASKHQHRHQRALTLRALFIGTVHGLAGSAALVMLTLGGIGSTGLGFSYMALFGVGSLIGMAALSGVIAVPLRITSLRLTWAYNGLTVGVGLVSVGLGAALLIEYVPLIAG